jgi:hypothetical protein
MLRREAGRDAREVVRFIRDSGVYSLCDRGHLNLYQPFLERALSLVRPGGRIGLVLPWGLAVDDGAAKLRRHLLEAASIDTIVGLDNANGLFPIHRGLRFLVLVSARANRTREIRARFGVRTAEAIAALPDSLDASWKDDSYPVRMASEDLARLGGATRRIPDVRRAGDLAILDRLTREHAPLGSAHGWGLKFGRELNATDDRSSFGDRGLPVLEGKHVQPFVVDVGAPASRILPATAKRLLPRAPFERPRLAYRDVSGVSNRTSLIAAVVPAGAVTTHTLFCAREAIPLERQHFLCGVFNSYVLNSLVRMLMGGHVTTSLIEDLPVPAWSGSSLQRTIARLAERLSRAPARTAWRVRIQAAVARLYDLQAVELRGVLEGFPLVPADERAATLAAFERRAASIAL